LVERSHHDLGSKTTLDYVDFSRRAGGDERVTFAILSCPCPGVQSSTRASCTQHCTIASDMRHYERPSLRFRYPTTLKETGSDQHRAYLTRLCSASRLSRPLDALLRPQPFPPCFMRITPLGFCFQRFSLPGSEEHLTASLPFMPFLATPATTPASRQRSLRNAVAPRSHAPEKSVSTNTVLPDGCRPILS
jgi:hypothetical protein